MSIQAFVGVKDEFEVLPYCVDNLVRLGFDHVLIVPVEPEQELLTFVDELCSRYDNVTSFAIKELDRQGEVFSLAQEPGLSIFRKYNPDRVLLCDADEFLFTGGKDIHETLAGETRNFFEVVRFNYARRRSEGERDVLASIGNLADAPLIYDKQPSVHAGTPIPGRRWSQHTIGPKLMISPKEIARLAPGAHGAFGADGTRMAFESTNRMLLAHFPFTSFERFDRKIRNAREHLEMVPEIHVRMSWHWKWWVRELEAGNLPKIFDNEAFADAEFESLRGDGAIRTTAEILAALSAAPADAGREDAPR